MPGSGAALWLFPLVQPAPGAPLCCSRGRRCWLRIPIGSLLLKLDLQLGGLPPLRNDEFSVFFMHLGQQLLCGLHGVLVLVEIRARDAKLQWLVGLLLVHPLTVATPPATEAGLTLGNLLPYRTCNILNHSSGSLELLVVLNAHLKPAGILSGLPGHSADPPLSGSVRRPRDQGVGVRVAILQETQGSRIQPEQGVRLGHQMLL
mmetsp:Transcript_44234/g.96221  ORF Transcript_44234/g.96221 Transcript_44234/m.96221 type:complete len:204 (+) Transcript_44234:393-1004(+)